MDGVDTNYMLDDWITRRPIFTTKNHDLHGISKIAGWYIPGEMETCTSTDIVENEDDYAVKLSVGMMIILGQESALPDQILTLKEAFIALFRSNIDPKDGYLNGVKFVVKNMINNDFSFGSQLLRTNAPN